jgi:FkbM family methyltransferase
MKGLVKKVLQSLLGFNNYLFIFSIFTIYTLRWKKNEGDFLHFLKIIPEKSTILDIGANIGIMTVHFARKYRKSVIYAFEPIPHNIRALKRIIKFFRLKNVKVIETALGNEDGTISMVMPVIKSVKMQGLSHVVHESIPELNEGDKFITPIHKIDSYTELHNECLPVAAIKIDVENFEYFVLEGARRLIEKSRPLIYAELWDTENRKKCFKLLAAYNYSVMVLNKTRLVPFDENIHKMENFFFIPEQKVT